MVRIATANASTFYSYVELATHACQRIIHRHSGSVPGVFLKEQAFPQAGRKNCLARVKSRRVLEAFWL
jgi:hypothetical protein